MKIIIKVPKKEGRWKVSINHSTYVRVSATKVFMLVEKKLLASSLKEKTSILVNYNKNTSNETMASLDTRYLLYTLGAFLEEYLEDYYLTRVFKQYQPL